MQAERITDAIAHHGEGAVWSSQWGGLRWVDILAGGILSLDRDGRVRSPGTEPGIRPVIQTRSPGGAVLRVPVSCRLSPTGIGFLDILFPPETSALLTVGLPRRPGRRGLCRDFRVPHA